MSRIKVESFEDARELTLKKWKDVFKNLERLGEGIECGFCSNSNYLSLEHLIESMKTERCFYCPVERKCTEIQLASEQLLYPYMNKIEELIRWLRDIKEKNLKSRYQLKGGE